MAFCVVVYVSVVYVSIYLLSGWPALEDSKASSTKHISEKRNILFIQQYHQDSARQIHTLKETIKAHQHIVNYFKIENGKINVVYYEGNYLKQM